MAKIHLVANTFQIKELFKVVANYGYYLYGIEVQRASKAMGIKI